MGSSPLSTVKETALFTNGTVGCGGKARKTQVYLLSLLLFSSLIIFFLFLFMYFFFFSFFFLFFFLFFFF